MHTYVNSLCKCCSLNIITDYMTSTARFGHYVQCSLQPIFAISGARYILWSLFVLVTQCYYSLYPILLTRVALFIAKLCNLEFTFDIVVIGKSALVFGRQTH